jgi:hypothetical protein
MVVTYVSGYIHMPGTIWIVPGFFVISSFDYRRGFFVDGKGGRGGIETERRVGDIWEF